MTTAKWPSQGDGGPHGGRRRVRFMAKSQLFRGALAWILRHGGAFPVQRGRHDEQAIATALEILKQGGVEGEVTHARAPTCQAE